jgi:hypothetical protein
MVGITEQYKRNPQHINGDLHSEESPTSTPLSSHTTLVRDTGTLSIEDKLSQEKASFEPQNALTRHFTEAEWNALRRLRVSSSIPGPGPAHIVHLDRSDCPLYIAWRMTLMSYRRSQFGVSQ